MEVGVESKQDTEVFKYIIVLLNFKKIGEFVHKINTSVIKPVYRQRSNILQ
jgi:hypothetical protein